MLGLICANIKLNKVSRPTKYRMESIVKGNMDEGKSPQDVEFNYRDFVRVSLSISQIHYGVRVNVCKHKAH